MKGLKRLAALFLTVFLVAGMGGELSYGALVDVGNNEFIDAKRISNGKTGKNMTVSFNFVNRTGRDLKNVTIGFSEDVDFSDDADRLDNGYKFPFEVGSDTFKGKNIGTIKSGSTKSVALSAKVRRDLAEGYYAVPLKISGDDFSATDEYVNIWISKSTTTDDEDKDDKKIDFTLGENQATPYGAYPGVMNFDINMRNKSTMSAFDVTISMVLSKDSAEFPFDINDGNYDRHFDKLEAGETVPVNYSMGIRSDVYSGYFPIKFNITYRDSTDGELMTLEKSFYVKVKNKEKEDNLGDFNVNDRVKARIVVDSFETVPSEIYAGEEFELVLRMKNASSAVSASNILFTLESEKVSDSAVFSTESGSSSFVVNQLGAGEVTELRVKLLSKAGVDQRSYSITINEKYDSPEFKNADEKVMVDVPIKQRARLNTGTIEVMPDNINVGSETNVMFGINNTGKVMLYNVMAIFESDSIQKTDAYVGNIKPGDTGNVDVMVSGIAPTADEGKVKITITYEDENGEMESVEKEMSLFVNEDLSMGMGDVEAGDFGDYPMEPPSFFQTYKNWIFAGAALVVVLAAGAAILLRKKKKASRKEEEEMEDEIS